MLPTLKSEYRKLLTVRSTYAITGLVLLFVSFIAFYAQGLRLNPGNLFNPNQLAGEITGLLNITLIGAIVAILLMTHEYRYNTVTYTLSSSKSRSVVLLAKIIVVSTYSLLLAAIIGIIVPLLSIAGVQAHGLSFITAQQLPVWNLVWRGLFFSWGYGMAGLLIATLVRSQVVAITAIFLLPSVVEPLLGLALHQKAVYLPFATLDQVTTKSNIGPGLSPLKALGLFSVYLIVGWAVAWYLYLERDAA